MNLVVVIPSGLISDYVIIAGIIKEKERILFLRFFFWKGYFPVNFIQVDFMYETLQVINQECQDQELSNKFILKTLNIFFLAH